MLTHEQIWKAVDRLATNFGYSPSGLAKKSGLDPTSFNKSKRFGPDGKPRWPSTESISRILGATGATMSDFISLVDNQEASNNALTIPVTSFKQAGGQGFFDKNGYPVGNNWNEINFPEYNSAGGNEVYGLEISDDYIAPLYRKGDVLLLSPKSKMQTGDRIVLKMSNGDLLIKELLKQSASSIEVASLNNKSENKKINTKDIAWTARIIWASQ